MKISWQRHNQPQPAHQHPEIGRLWIDQMHLYRPLTQSDDALPFPASTSPALPLPVAPCHANFFQAVQLSWPCRPGNRHVYEMARRTG
jgi:hypothetical protein